MNQGREETFGVGDDEFMAIFFGNGEKEKLAGGTCVV